MTDSSDSSRVSVPFRVAAWILALGHLAVLIDFLVRLLDPRLDSRSEAVMATVAGAFGLVIFGYVALTGRAPAPIRLLEDTWSNRFDAKRSPGISTRSKLRCWIVALVTGNALIAAADANALFDDDVRGLVLLIYAISAVSLVALAWRYFRRTPNAAPERTRAE